MTPTRLANHSRATLRFLLILTTAFVLLSTLGLVFLDPFTAAVLLILALPGTIMMANLGRALIAREGARD